MQDRSLTFEDYGGDGGLPDGLQLRKLNQPFAGHDDDDDADAQGEAGGGGGDNEGEEGGSGNSSSSGKVYSTCRNSVQGKVLIADDRGNAKVTCLRSRLHVLFCLSGCVCHRNDIQGNGCCNLNATLTKKYHCEECDTDEGCCKVYEHCVSCCMQPNKVWKLKFLLP